MDDLLQRFDLLAQAVQDREAARDGQDLVGLDKQALKFFLRQLANPLDTEARTSITHHDVLHAEHIGRVLTHPVRALTQQISYRPRGFATNISFAQYPQS